MSTEPASLSDGEITGEENSSSEKFQEKVLELKWLAEREKQLKIAIFYEKYRKIIPVTTDKDLLCGKIADLQTTLREMKSDNTMKDMKNTKMQYMMTLEKIVHSGSRKGRQGQYSESQKRSIKELLKTEKDLTKKIATRRQEIDSMEEMNGSKIDIMSAKERNMNADEKATNGTCSGNRAEIERLQRSNTQVTERIQLLARVTGSLIAHLHTLRPETQQQLGDLLRACEEILDGPLDNPDTVNDLLKTICAINI